MQGGRGRCIFKTHTIRYYFIFHFSVHQHVGWEGPLCLVANAELWGPLWPLSQQATGPWAGGLIAPCLNFPILKEDTVIVPAFQASCQESMRQWSHAPGRTWHTVQAREGAGSHPCKKLGPPFDERVSENIKMASQSEKSQVIRNSHVEPTVILTNLFLVDLKKKKTQFLKLHKACPSPHDWITKVWCIHTMECYSARTRTEVLIHARTWMDPKSSVLSEKKPVTKGHAS